MTMKRIIQNSAITLLSTLIFLFGLSSCEEEELAKDESFSSNEFRILKIEDGNNVLEQGEQGIPAAGLALVVTLSHPVEQGTLAAGFSASGEANFILTSSVMMKLASHEAVKPPASVHCSTG